MPRAGLSRARVVDIGAEVADELGWERLSLAAVAQRCDVRLPSLYKHVESLEVLRQEIAALATRQLAEALAAAATGVSGEQALQGVCDAYRRFALRYPGRYAATIRPPQSREPAVQHPDGGDAQEAQQPDGAPAEVQQQHRLAAQATLDVVLAVLSGYGLRGARAIDAARALRAALHGFAALEGGGGFGMPRDVARSYRAMVDGLHRMLESWPSSRSGRAVGVGEQSE
ncbi:MAG: TetR/AcrR family transcriptional regulator [Actinomycetales bacterium]